MSHASYFTYAPVKLADLTAPLTLACSEVSVVIPVRDNQAGIERFLTCLFETHDRTALPRKIIIVDNASAVPIYIPDHFVRHGMSIRLLHCDRRGPAAARNAGALEASGEWLLFTDSDCVPTSSFITGYAGAMRGSVGYAGRVRAIGEGCLARYYESQSILVPPLGSHDRPLHLITANALVWRPAFVAVGGFNERFLDAAGEDIDLGLRLRQVGELAYVPSAEVAHDFGEGIGRPRQQTRQRDMHISTPRRTYDRARHHEKSRASAHPLQNQLTRSSC